MIEKLSSLILEEVWGLPNICRNIFDVGVGLLSKKAISENISTVKKNS